LFQPKENGTEHEVDWPNKEHTKANSKRQPWTYGAAPMSNLLEEQSQVIVIVFALQTWKCLTISMNHNKARILAL
jgi:hypothetical protein